MGDAIIRLRVLPALIPSDAAVEVGAVTTLPPGEPATVVNVGTPSDVVLNFGIPAGEAGAPGADGTDGNDGADGLIQSIVAGTNVSVDNTDPANPVVSASSGGVSDGDKGDIIVASSGTVWTFDTSVVTAAAKTVLDDASTAAMLITLGAQPVDADLTSWAAITRASGFDTFVATPSSANLRALLTDEVGTGAAYFVGGALGTPASATLTNATGLPVAGITASTSAALGVGSIELGHATDTTLSRSAAGRLAVEGADVLLASIEDQTITGGARVTPKSLGNLSGASITPDPGDRAIQTVTNNGAGSILPGSNTGIYTLEVLNASGAGAITTTGWALKGDSFDTTTTSQFICSCIVTANTKLMTIVKVA